ncbi:MAG TPA: hypothetical protein VMG40_01925 [Bryobacteraceae bacterium]|nr:hypothetical protein [Bryobacteraceae bacterium]
MRIRKLLPLSVPLALLFGQSPPAGDGTWPREIQAGSIHLTIYQPQVDRWEGNKIDSRSAVIATRAGDPAQIFGTVSIHARTEVDRESRLVSFEDISIKQADFPTAAALEPTLLKAVRDSLPNWPRTVSLDRLLADLSITQAESKAEAVHLRNNPPKIIFSKTPSVLILIDGEPVYRVVEATFYQRIVNTPALILFDPAANTFYLDGGNYWMTASNLKGPWTLAVNPPADLESVKEQLTSSEEREPSEAPPVAPGNPPAVFVSTVPAELLVTRGEPAYAPIAGANLLYVTNSDNDIFVDTKTQRFYTLLAGRWFRANSLESSWEWVPGEQLPHDFAKISPDSPKGHVLASIPGTEQAREAMIANQIPQTATVRRSEAKLEVHYDGDPIFQPIEGTSMQYAVNTSSEVVLAGGRYYAVEHGVWFVADAATGPWSVADTIPAEIYGIPPSSPLYHLRYVYVYGATPEYVYVGYTPGYMGAFIDDGVVVFGTGWWYPGWCGIAWPFYCYGWPWTWGLGFEFSYWGGGWFWHPSHYYWWYHNSPLTHRVFSEHWNPQWRGANRAWIHGNVNAYSHWQGNAVMARNIRAPEGGRVSGAARPDLYAGHQGQVYEHRSDGWYQRNGAGQWQKMPSSPQLDQQRQSRSLGQSRQREFQNRGQSPGIPRTTMPRPAPMRPSAPMRPAAPPRTGGRGRG